MVAGEISRAVVREGVIFTLRLVIGDIGLARRRRIDGGAEVVRVGLEVGGGLGERGEGKGG